MADHEIRVRTWVKASEVDIRTGLLGWLSIECGPLILDSVALRRTSDGSLALSYPGKAGRYGCKHGYIRPADKKARLAIEVEVIRQLHERGDLLEQAGASDA